MSPPCCGMSSWVGTAARAAHQYVQQGVGRHLNLQCILCVCEHRCCMHRRMDLAMLQLRHEQGKARQ